MLSVPDDLPEYLVLPVRVLNRVKAYLPIYHAEVRPEVLAQRIVPVLKIPTRPSRPVITMVPSALLSEGIVELVLRPEASVEFVLEGVHELPVLEALKLVVVQLVVVDEAQLLVV